MPLVRGCVLSLALTLSAVPATAQPQDDAAETAGAPANAAERLTFGTQDRPERTIFFSALLGAQTGPAYFGSDEMELGPSFRGGLGYLDFGGINFGRTDLRADPYERRSGFGYGLSFRFIQARDSDDHDELDGLDDIDPTLEIGGVVGYVWPNVEALAETRYGFGGSEAWVSEAKMNFVARPMEGFTLRAGPRVVFGTDRFVDTYFGVTSEESARSGLSAYDPDPGIVSTGVEVIATYRLGERWWLEGAARWDRFQGDAADSPIVRGGSDESTRIRIGLRRAFTLQF